VFLAHNVNLMLGLRTFSGAPLPSEVFTGASFPGLRSPTTTPLRISPPPIKAPYISSHIILYNTISSIEVIERVQPDGHPGI